MKFKRLSFNNYFISTLNIEISHQVFWNVGHGQPTRSETFFLQSEGEGDGEERKKHRRGPTQLAREEGGREVVVGDHRGESVNEYQSAMMRSAA